MNERWHELNLVKCVNTVLVIEGGCTKKVSDILYMVMINKTFHFSFIMSLTPTAAVSLIHTLNTIFHTMHNKAFVIVW